MAAEPPDHCVLAERVPAGCISKRLVRSAAPTVPPADLHTDRRGEWLRLLRGVPAPPLD